MPTRSEIHKMRKPALVKLGISMFEDEGSLLEDLESMNIPDLKELIIDNMTEEELAPEILKEVPQVTRKGPASPLDLGTFSA